MTAILQAWIEGVGVLAPGLGDWPAARECLAGRVHYASAPTQLPAPSCLQMAERRRAGPGIKLALAVGSEAVTHSGRQAAELAAVFSASSGDGGNCHAICEMLAGSDRLISPTRFHNSVHNAPAGYWSIGQHAMPASTSLCAYDASFGAGLLEALCQLPATPHGVLLVTTDTPYPEPLQAKRPMPDAFGIAMVLAREQSSSSVARLSVSLVEGASPTPLSDAGLEALRAAIPAGRGLPLLQALACGGGEATLDYLTPLALRVKVEVCA